MQNPVATRFTAPVVVSTAIFLAFAAAAEAQEKPACAADQRLIESRLLVAPVCVPVAPSRVAFIDDNVTSALELGVPSVTRSYYSDVIVADFPGVASRLDPADTTHIGNTWEMAGEVLLNAHPDLVITGKYWDEAIPLAQAIAPTLVIDDERATDWRDVPRLMASLFGREAEQAELEAGVDRRLADFGAALAASGAGRSFTFTQIESDTSFWTFTIEAFGTEFATTAGMELGKNIPTPAKAAEMPGASTMAIPVSPENLSFVDADHIFFYANLGSDPEAMVKNNELFQRFAAARPGRVHFIKGEYWFRAGAMSAHRMLDDLYGAVLGVDPAEVSPNPLAWTYQPAGGQ